MNSFLLHYQELALKGRNRPLFVDRLVRNVGEACLGLGVAEVRALMGRLEVTLEPDADRAAIAERLRHLFGIANFSLAVRVPPSMDAITSEVMRQVQELPPTTFRVRVARADKAFPIQSPDVERELGALIHTQCGWPVDLSDPARIVHVEIVPGAAFCHVDKERGQGGLPTGVSGRVACLLSGGIDSPVAAWRLMRRGCRALFIHFHAYPIVSLASQEKVRRIVEVLTRYQLQSRLVLVPFGELQRRLVVTVEAPLRVVLYRRLMFRIADRIAWRAGTKVLVTGEAVGQVASQTLDNIAMIGGASRLTVLRPLVGMDKEEITAEARRIGTYQISILPDEDCCQVFTPKHPVTRARVEEIEREEASLPVEALVEAAIAGAVFEEFPRQRPAPLTSG